MSIELDEGILPRRSGNGPSLYFASAMPKSSPKAVLAILHGYAEHGARYAHVMGALAEHQIGSIALDMRGHGRAQGLRGHCMHFSEYLDDADELRRQVEARVGSVPSFLFGHSFGGLVATSSALENESSWRGLVLSSPYFGLGLEVPRAKLLAGKLASRLVPKLGLKSGLAGKDVTHDPVKAKAYDTDPLVFPHANVRWFTEALAAQARALAGAPRLRMPLYMTVGTEDRIASVSVAKRFFDAAGSADKTWDPREGLYHEVLNEPSWKDILENIARWILAHA